ncbi:hypothetical protein [uncultured Nostoc sp.]|uniref:hypothetical protein n=1 Tax=uncultured Nostoc sp. TaxID=340711 RepID=UPI0035C947F0
MVTDSDIDDTQSQSASLLIENQDCGIEAVIPYEGKISAPKIEKCSNQGQAQQSQSTSLLVGNQDFSDKSEVSHEDTCSAALV